MAGPAVYMWSPTAVQSMSEDEAKLNPVGTGPFKFQSFETDLSLKFERFDDYWIEGLPYLDGIEYVLIADPVTGRAEFETGAVHSTRVRDTIIAAELADAGYAVNKTPGIMYGLAGDSAHPTSPFADIRVRRAVAYAIDLQGLADSVGMGLVPAINQLAAPGTPAHNPDVVGYPYNPEKARELLAEVGIDENNPLQTSILAQNITTDMDLYTAIQGMLSAVNIECELDWADWGRYLQVRGEGWNDSMVRFDFPSMAANDTGTTLMSFMSSTTTFVDPNSLKIFESYETALLEAVGILDTAERNAAYSDIMKIIIDDHCMVIPCYLSYAFCAYDSERVKDFDLFAGHSIQWSPHLVWLSGE